MSNLAIPETWAIAKLGDFLKIKRGASPRPVGDPKYFGRTGCGWLKISDLTRQGKYITETREFLTPAGVDKSVFVPAGDLVLSNSATIGLPAITKIPLCVHDGFLTFPNLPKEIDLDYFYNFFLAFRSTFQNRSIKGATQANLNIEIVSKIECPLPPLGEQKRIVAKLERTQEKIKAIEQSVTKAEELIGRYREALLQKAFRGELVPQDPNDEPASKLLERIRADRAKQTDGKKKKKDELPPIKPEEIPFEIPKSWEWVRLAELASRIVDGTHHTPKYMGSGVPFLSAKDIVNGVLCFDNTKFISKSEHEGLIQRCRPEIGDVLCTKSGTIGRTAVVKTEREFSLFESVALIKTIKPLSPEYLEIAVSRFVNSSIGKGQVKGAAIKHLHLEDLREATIPLPPLREQIRIVDLLQIHWEKAAAHVDALKKILTSTQLMNSSVLNCAFTGRLVPQESTEGTGHELLQKIRAQISDKGPQTTKVSKAKPKKRAKA